MSMIRMDSSALGDYDWSNEENAGKWRGLFVDPLQKVLVQVHPQFTAKDDALEYVESLLIRLLAMLTAKPAPCTVADVEVRPFFWQKIMLFVVWEAFMESFVKLWTFFGKFGAFLRRFIRRF